MARMWLVRHAEAAAGWGDHPDPGLSEIGHQQAEALARRLAPLGPLPIRTSPLRRCRETARPLAARWDAEPLVDERVGEIVTPTDDLEQRPAWLREVLRSAWSELADGDRRWRDQVVEHLVSFTVDTVVFTHFVLANVALGHAIGDDRVVCFRPAHCSITLFDVAGGRIQVAGRGEEMASRVL